MGKLLSFLTILIFIDLMFFIFINLPASSLNGVLFQSVNILSGGNVAGNQTGNWGIKEMFFCDSGSFRDMISNPNSACSSSTLIGALLIGLLASASIGIFLLLTKTNVNALEVAWTAVGVFFYTQLGADFVGIYNYLQALHPPLTRILAMVLIVPIGIIYMFTIVEWIRGKD